MRKTVNILTLLLCIFLCGCEKEDYRSFEETQVKIESSNVIFTAAGGTGSIEVASPGSYSATVNQNWCKLNTSGSKITVTVDPNMSALSRSANITIKLNDKINFVPVTQTGVYIHLESYDAQLLGNGGSISIPYESDAPITTVKSDAAWISGQLQNGKIVLQAAKNPDFLNKRKATITLFAVNNITLVKLNVVQNELISSVEPDPNVDAVDAFLNLKNNGTSSSRYKITQFSSRLATLQTNLKTAFPVFKEFRIEAPRGTYGVSILLYNVDSGDKYYYWNCTNGLVRLANSKYDAYFAWSGNSVVGGWTCPYTSNANYTSLYNFFVQNTGFTIIQDGDAFWFKSKADPQDWFKVEPTSW